jgi:DNA repair and recombination RAD54-like protein
MEDPDKPTLNRAVVVCPTSLVKNWDDEIIKWLKGKVKTIALFGTDL